MVYQRPSIGTMQRWADEVGDQSWTWNGTLPYYARSATFTPPKPGVRPDNATPGYDTSVFAGGPVQASYPNYASPFGPHVFKGWSELGETVRERGMESGDLLGHQWVPQSLEPRTQERSSGETSYLALALRTTKLSVYTHALVKRVLFHQDKTATGVEVETAGQRYTVSASKEVILSAGAFQSPQLLMVSGVGPAETLQKYDIPVVVDRPGVGQDMQDNPLFGITYAVNIETGSTYMNDPSRLAQAVEQYNANRTGYLTTAGAEVLSFQKLATDPTTNISAQARRALDWVPDDWPDMQYWSFTQWIGPQLGSLPPDARNYASMSASNVAPLSRGSLTIQSPDMADAPVIDPNWMTDPTDQELAVAAMRRLRALWNTPSLQGLVDGEEAFPGPNVTTYADLLATVHEQTSTFGHASRTCKMGSANDSMAVVDSKARVFGVKGLRVVDISAFPFLPPGQPQATVYMFGEKIADEILHGGEGHGTRPYGKPW